MEPEFRTWLLSMDSSANLSPLLSLTSREQSFEEWFFANGGYLHPEIELILDPAKGKSLRVKHGHTISPGSKIVSCPHHLALSWPTACKFHFPNIRFPSFSQQVATRFFLMKQRLLGDLSSWSPYIKTLPCSFDTPLYYGPEDLAWIRGTNLGHTKKVREAAWREEYDGAMEILFPNEIDDRQKTLWTWSVLAETQKYLPGDADLPQGSFFMGSNSHVFSSFSWSCSFQPSRRGFSYVRS